jgi:hypothetical protein
MLGEEGNQSTVKMINIFKEGEFLGNENVVNRTQMLSIFGKANTARVWHDRHTKSARLASSQ